MALLLAPAILAALAASPVAPAGSGCDPAANISVVVSPNPAAAGQPVTVALTNNSTTCTYTTSICVFHVIHEHACDGPVSKIEPCMLPAKIVLQPGDTFPAVWSPVNFIGQPLPDGDYALPIMLFEETTGTLGSLCAQVQIGHVACPNANYGTGKPGSGGIVPRLDTAGGFPKVGNDSFRLVLDHALAGTPALVLLGVGATSFQAPWGTLLVDVALPHLEFPLALLQPVNDGGGVADVALPIPQLPSLVGLQLFSQALLADPGATFGISHTSGLTFSICS